MKTVKYEKLTLSYDENYNIFTVSECEKDAENVVIPKSVNGIYISAIDDRAFSGCTKLVLVKFPTYEEGDYGRDDLLTVIGANAFMDCVSLEQVILPETVTEIGRGAFYYCKNLKYILFADNVFADAFAFYHCESLVEVPKLNVLTEGVFSHCLSLKYAPIADDVEEICEDAFEHCESLTEVTIPETVTRIESEAFSNCYQLKKVHFKQQKNWFWHCVYTDEEYPIDVSDPEKNAKSLSTMDFDDGVSAWFVKK